MDELSEAVKGFMKAIAPAVKEYVSKKSQEASYAIGDLLDPLDKADTIIFLAVMQLVVEAHKSRLGIRDRRVFDHIVEHSTLTILPTEFDPRKKENAEDADRHGADGASQ